MDQGLNSSLCRKVITTTIDFRRHLRFEEMQKDEYYKKDLERMFFQENARISSQYWQRMAKN